MKDRFFRIVDDKVEEVDFKEYTNSFHRGDLLIRFNESRSRLYVVNDGLNGISTLAIGEIFDML